MIDTMHRDGGGPAANAAVAMARLGARVSFAGAVGNDALGREQTAQLAAEGVDVSGVATVAGVPSFVSFILVDASDGARTIYSAPSERPLAPAAAPPPLAPRPHIVLVDAWGGEHQLRTAAAAREAGIPVLLDAGSDREATRALLPHCDLVIASTPFAEALTGPHREADAVRALLEGGAALAAVTRGERGVVAGAAGSRDVFEVPAVRAPVVDTTGAGDAFHGGAAWALLSGWTWEESLRAAAWVAARKCGTFGARAGLPFLADLPGREALLTGVG